MEALVKMLKAAQKTQYPTNLFEDSEVLTNNNNQQTPQDEQVCWISNLITDCQEMQSQLDQYQAHLCEWKTYQVQFLEQLQGMVKQHKEVMSFLDQEDSQLLIMKTEGERKQKRLEEMLSCSKQNNKVLKDGPSSEVKIWMEKCLTLFPNNKTLNCYKTVRCLTKTALQRLAEEVGTADTSNLYDRSSTIMKKVNKTMALEAMVNQAKPKLPQIQEVPQIMSTAMPVNGEQRLEGGDVYWSLQNQGRTRSSRVTIENGRVYLHCLLNHPPPSHARTLPVSEVLSAFDSSSTLAFLDLSWGGLTRGRVHIRLSPDTPLARQFVLLCTSQCAGDSYRNTVMLQVYSKGQAGERVWGGDYQRNTGEGGAPLLFHEADQEYQWSGKAGAVWSRWRPDSAKSAQFGISTRDLPDGGKWPFVFGQVESGLEVVQAAANQSDIRQVTVVDCGVVLPH